MGEEVGERGGLGRPGPSNATEAVVAFFIPPACREEILGDLHERYRSGRQYCFDALRTIPLVVASRIRRTSDPQLLLMQAFALYLSFLGAAWFWDREFLYREWALFRLAVPAPPVLATLMLEDAYARPGIRPPLRLVRGPALGVALAVWLQGILGTGASHLAIPRAIVLYGSVMSLLLTSAIRVSFPPITRRLLGANGLDDRPVETRKFVPGLAIIAAVVAAAVFQVWDGAVSARLVKIGMLAVVLLIAYRLSRQA